MSRFLRPPLLIALGLAAALVSCNSDEKTEATDSDKADKPVPAKPTPPAPDLSTLNLGRPLALATGLQQSALAAQDVPHVLMMLSASKRLYGNTVYRAKKTPEGDVILVVSDAERWPTAAQNVIVQKGTDGTWDILTVSSLQF